MEEEEEVSDPSSYCTTTISSATAAAAAASAAVAGGEREASNIVPILAEDLYQDTLEYSSPKGGSGCCNAQKWVTLSANGEDLEVAEIRPTIQQVKIAAGGNTGYRIDPVMRKAIYVNDLPKSIKKRSFTSSSTKSSSNNFRGFKSPSPVKANRVIHLNNIVPNSDSHVSVSQVSHQLSSSSLPPGYSTSTHHHHQSSSSTTEEFLHPPPNKPDIGSASLLIPPAKKHFPSTVPLSKEVVSRPQLKIPITTTTNNNNSGNDNSSGSNSNNNSLITPTGRGKFIEQHNDGEDEATDEDVGGGDQDLIKDEDDEDEEYGVLSEEEGDEVVYDDDYMQTVVQTTVQGGGEGDQQQLYIEELDELGC